MAYTIAGLSNIVYAQHDSLQEAWVTPKQLGQELQVVRKMRKLSLQAAATPAGISAAYLQKLERGDVKEPSPRVLYGLSEALTVPYDRLMSLAGYVVPSADAQRSADTSVLGFALSSERLSEDESKALAEYLSWYRYDHERRRSED
jgi:HTH-type transcriptional regulator, competence development regulator